MRLLGPDADAATMGGADGCCSEDGGGGGGYGPDDVSSINTSLHDYHPGPLGGQVQLKILGTLEHDEEVPVSSHDRDDDDDTYGYNDIPMNKSARET